ncbi:putative membrane protein [Helicobacter pylori Hp P-26]|nr:putative membrane protein [Helicobacter pylori Hp P-26]
MENQGVRSFGFLRLLIFLFKALALSIFRVEMLFKIGPLA